MTTKVSGLRVARRLDEVGFSDIVQIRNKVMALRAAGEKVHMLHCGEPYFETPEPIKYAAIQAIVENQTHYAPSSGIAPLREALAAKLKIKPVSYNRVKYCISWHTFYLLKNKRTTT